MWPTRSSRGCWWKWRRLSHMWNHYGSLTGFDRTRPRSRDSLTDLPHNVALSFQTYTVDFFSPTTWAKPPSLDAHWSISLFEWGLLALLAVCVGASISAVILHSWRGSWALIPSHALGRLALEFVLVYQASLIVIWSLTNNDPIYSRFMWPVYFFVFICAANAHDIYSRTGNAWLRASWPLLAVGLVAAQVQQWGAL